MDVFLPHCMWLYLNENFSGLDESGAMLHLEPQIEQFIQDFRNLERTKQVIIFACEEVQWLS